MKPFLTVLLCTVSCALVAQKEASIWYFGHSAVLDFSTNCQPTALSNSRMSTMEGCVTISDGRTGQLQFYSDGFKVWNRDHQPMPSSGDADIREGINREYGALSQGALIVPSPADSALYYLFTLIERDPAVSAHESPGVLTYSRIDMRLDGSKGDVVLADKNMFLSGGLVGRLTAVPHTNGQDYWIVTHQWNTNSFLIYPLTKTGLGRADTIRIGPSIDDKYGMLKASPDGTKLACSSRGPAIRSFDLFDFNAATGQITDYVNLGNVRSAYGVSFSPDNTKLYVSNMTTAGVGGSTYYPELIRQYDLKAGNADAIIQSGKSIIYQNTSTNVRQDNNRYSDFYAPSLQIGPDGRIYCASNANDHLCLNCGYRFLVINRPNELGFGCNVQLQVAELGKGLVGNASDLPNFMQHYFNKLESKDCNFDRNDECTDANVQVFPNPAKDVIELLVTDICFTPYTLRIVNVTGQMLAVYNVDTPFSQKLDVSPLASGMYFAELRFPNRTAVKRFIKQ